MTPTTNKITVQSLISSMVPSFTYIVATPQAGSLQKPASDMDLLLPITNLNLTIGNHVGFMCGDSPSKLYQNEYA